MRKQLLAVCAAGMLTLTGCATIISGSTQAITIKSVPEAAKLSITNKSGEKIHTGETPATVTLKRGAGFFQPQHYQVTLEKDGYQTKTVSVSGTLNGWYIGNLIFGGPLGILIIDPLTGAMYSLTPSEVTTGLSPAEVKAGVNSKGQVQMLTVMLVQDVPAADMQRAKLIGNM